MDAYYVSDISSNEEIINGANDARFGCQKVTSIDVDIFENYEGYEVLIEQREIKIDDDSNVKKGI